MFSPNAQPLVNLLVREVADCQRRDAVRDLPDSEHRTRVHGVEAEDLLEE